MPARRRRRILPLLLSLLVLLGVGLVGAYVSTATIADEVSFVTGQAHGGTLDLALEEAGFGIDGAALAGVAPGTSRSSEFTVENTGSIPADLAFVVDGPSGTDPAGCIDYRILGADRAVLLDAGSLDRAVALPLGAIQPGAAGTRTFTLELTNREDCRTNGATGSLRAKVTALQQEQDS